MLFKQAQEVLDGRKRQTRRLVRPGDMPSHDEKGNIVAVYRNGRLLWKVGKDYAVQPGRTQKSIGRTPPLKAIRCERLQEISLEDVEAEGVMQMHSDIWIKGVYDFADLWDSLHRKPDHWEHNPAVWVLEFEPI